MRLRRSGTGKSSRNSCVCQRFAGEIGQTQVIHRLASAKLCYDKGGYARFPSDSYLMLRWLHALKAPAKTPLERMRVPIPPPLRP
jgi:hypothetical protein